MDWTDFDADNQSTLALHLVTRHGRATPLLWLTVDKDELKNRRNDFEDCCLARLKECLPEGVAVTILADRGFGDVKLFAFLESLGFRYVIRFRGNIHVSAVDGETRLAADWVGKGGRARKLRDAEITAARHKVGAVVCVKAVGMKDAWHLAASDGALSAPTIIKLYSRRWTIEPSFRDSKDLRFGMGLSALRIDDPQRRDRLLLLNAFAILLLTILGAAGESLGMDRHLANQHHQSAASIRCFDKAGCSTNSSPTCQNRDCGRSSNDIRSFYTKTPPSPRLSVWRENEAGSYMRCCENYRLT